MTHLVTNLVNQFNEIIHIFLCGLDLCPLLSLFHRLRVDWVNLSESPISCLASIVFLAFLFALEACTIGFPLLFGVVSSRVFILAIGRAWRDLIERLSLLCSNGLSVLILSLDEISDFIKPGILLVCNAEVILYSDWQLAKQKCIDIFIGFRINFFFCCFLEVFEEVGERFALGSNLMIWVIYILRLVTPSGLCLIYGRN